MLRIGDDWSFPIDPEASRLWLSPKGTWGLEILCRETAVKTDDGLGATFTPRLAIKDLEFDGLDWRELVGLEIYQHTPWLGEGDPAATLFVVEDGDLSETKIRVTGHRGAELMVEIETLADIFFDDSHDKEVPIRFEGFLRFSGVRFRFKAEGAASRDPGRRASELLSVHLAPQAFATPEVTKVGAGLYEAYFPPALDEGEPPTREMNLADLVGGASGAAPVSAEVNVLRQSARELLDAMVRQGWVELEDDAKLDTMIAEFVDVLEEGGRGAKRAERVSEWLMDRDEVADLHVLDEELAPVLDKFW
ncbi:MAG: hypothetical protein H6720_24995 [Sandaracinus sp.]|nr:hypothetical protein [Sandaracinus sp.]MCB9622043.1 hypothetical protein [Sandaracinus sp.]